MRRDEACLVLNAGSSSLKFCVFGGDPAEGEMRPMLTGQIQGIGSIATFEARDAERHVLADHTWDARDSACRDTMLQHVLRWLPQTLPDTAIVAVGHRVVHGGPHLDRPQLITPELLVELERLVPLAPLHQPHNLAPVRILAQRQPELPQVACFDTAFHRTQPWVARTFALPRELSDEGVCRYGFHGLSYEYVSQRLTQLRPELTAAHVVVCHLGNGSSLCAVKGGRSMDTSMGFTALDGVPMGTRSGSVDPGVLLYLMREKKMDLDAIEDLLYRRSGLLGVSGLSNDMRVLLSSDDAHARDAVELFCFRVAKEIAALASSMGGLDALVFTAGIGENSPPVRQRICERMAWLGVEIDAERNAARSVEVSAADSRIPVFVVPTNEELMIARHTMRVLRQAQTHTA